MRRGVPVKPFEFQRFFEQRRDGFIFPLLFFEARLGQQRFRESHRISRIVRHQFAEPVNLSVRHVQYTADIAQHRTRLQLSEGDDLGNTIAPVFFLNIADDFVATVLTEIDIEVRHGYAFRIEEPLKQQAEAQGIEIGNGQRPGNQRPGTGTTPRPHGHALTLCPLNKVSNNQEVARKPHAIDDVEFGFQPLPIFRFRRGWINRAQP